MIPLLLPCVVGASGYALYTSIASIQNVRTYEEQTKQAAKISNIAEEQLNNTRTTEAAGALATAVSLLTATAFTVYPNQSPGIQLGFAGFNVAALAFASDHISRFWRGKSKVPLPGAGNYNDAISQMETLTRTLWMLAVAWVVEFGVVGWGFMSA